jgi:hypothetical protein
MTFGDPRYMSPEQARGDRIDRRADIYQLGCVAYEMLTGAPPFTGSRVFDILTKQVTEVPAPVPTRRPGTPLWMEAAVVKMLAKDPENRFATTTRMVEALRRGLETGQVMEDEIARRRESIPPPSVSRVMERMGMSQPAEAPREHMPQRELPPLPPGPGPVTEPQVPVDATAPFGAVGGARVPAVEPSPAAQAPSPTPRRRTGTPEVGVPQVAVQPPVAGSIDHPAGRAKAPSRDPMGISQVWYEDGERASEEAESSRARRVISPSTTDMSLFDEAPLARRRWPLVLGSLGVVAVIGTAIAFAMSHGDSSAPSKPAPPPPVLAAAPATDVAPSTVIEPEGSAAPAPAPEPAVVAPSTASEPAKTDPPKEPAKEPAKAVTPTKSAPPAPPHKATQVAVRESHPPAGGDEDYSKRRPSGLDSGPTTTVVKTGPGSSSGKNGVSGADGPQDPYSAGDATDPGDGAAPEKKAEFYANLGAQQLGSGDTAGAAASFKKALELDGKNVNAVIGMGEIALRQGLFGDAIAHLKKAARMAPKSSRVFTLLGEAYLNSGQNSVAAENFKKALQLDPDNARARDGYNEASSRVPAPTDD